MTNETNVTYVISKRTDKRVGTLLRLTRFYVTYRPLSGAPAIKESRFTGQVYVEEPVSCQTDDKDASILASLGISA